MYGMRCRRCIAVFLLHGFQVWSSLVSVSAGVDGQDQ